MKLTNLKGAEVLPKEITFEECRDMQKNHYNPYMVIDHCDGHNQCVQSLDKIGVVGRLKKAEIWEFIYNLMLNNEFSFQFSEIPSVNKDILDYIIDALIKHQSSLIELELVVEKE